MILFVDYISNWGEPITARVKFLDLHGVGIKVEEAYHTGTNRPASPDVLLILEQIDALREQARGGLKWAFVLSGTSSFYSQLGAGNYRHD